MEIPEKYLKMCDMPSLEEHLELYGEDNTTYLSFYTTFLIQSDKKILQNIREKKLGIETTLNDDEYLELEMCRQKCVEEIRKIESYQCLEDVVEEKEEETTELPSGDEVAE